MSNSDIREGQGRSYNYSIPALAPHVSPAPLRIDYLRLASLLAAVLFVLYGLLLLPLVGFQYDEVMFVYDLWHPEAAFSTIGIHHHFLPSMMMPYLGALKSWVYVPIFGVLGYSAYAVRLPMLLVSAITILLTGRLLCRIQGQTAATIAVVLLSTDVVFLVTSVFDWGPVVIQNCLLVLGLLCALQWYEGRRGWYALLTGLVCGLALWNKALFVWNFSGMVVGLLMVALPFFVRRLRNGIGWRHAAAPCALFVVGLGIGSAPLLKFNLQTHGSTLNSAGHPSPSEIGDKAWYFSIAINGEAAPSANVDLGNANAERMAHPLSSLAGWLASKFGPTPSSWRFPAAIVLLTSGLAVADRRQRNWIIFFLVSGFVGWLESALTPEAGRSIHHTVLFWINWYAALALACGCIAKRRPAVSGKMVAALVTVLALAGVLTIGVEYGDLLAHSPTTPWTDADAALASRLSALGVNHVLTTDWGIADPLALRSRNQIEVTEEVFNLNGGSFDAEAFQDCKAPGCVVITHVPGKVMLTKAAATLQASFKENEIAAGPETVVGDTHGTPTFLILPVVFGKVNPANVTTNFPSPTVSAKPLLLATPAVILTGGPSGRTTLTWEIPSDMFVEVHINAPDGPLFAAAKGPGQERTGLWVKNGTQFFLQDVTNGKSRTAENTVARAVVEVRPK